jgi:hypothetical protein
LPPDKGHVSSHTSEHRQMSFPVHTKINVPKPGRIASNNRQSQNVPNYRPFRSSYAGTEDTLEDPEIRPLKGEPFGTFARLRVQCQDGIGRVLRRKVGLHLRGNKYVRSHDGPDLSRYLP